MGHDAFKFTETAPSADMIAAWDRAWEDLHRALERDDEVLASGRFRAAPASDVRGLAGFLPSADKETR